MEMINDDTIALLGESVSKQPVSVTEVLVHHRMQQITCLTLLVRWTQ